MYRPAENPLAIQIRVVGALMMRDLVGKYGRANLSYLWAFVEPLAFIALMCVIFSYRRGDLMFGMPSVPFFATGILTYKAFRGIFNRMLRIPGQIGSLFLHPQIKIFDIMVSSVIMEVMTVFTIFTVFYGCMVFLELSPIMQSIVGVFSALSLAILLGLGFGLIIGSLSLVWPVVGRFIEIALRPLMLLSGVFYTMGSLPKQALDILWWNPVFHLVEYMREVYFSSFTSQHVDLYYVYIWVAICLPLGLLVERMTRAVKPKR